MGTRWSWCKGGGPGRGASPGQVVSWVASCQEWGSWGSSCQQVSVLQTHGRQVSQPPRGAGSLQGPSTTPTGGGEVAPRAQGSLSLGGSGLSPHCIRELGGTWLRGTCSLEGPLLLPHHWLWADSLGGTLVSDSGGHGVSWGCPAARPVSGAPGVSEDPPARARGAMA